MTCDQCERWLSEYVDCALTPAERESVESHLAGCADCRAVARELQQLDAALRRDIRAPALSAAFAGNLKQRIANESEPVATARYAERKRELQAEFEANVTKLRRRFLTSIPAIEILCLAAVAAVAIWLLPATAPIWTLVTRESTWLVSPGNQGQALVLSVLAAGLFLAIGLSVAFPQQWKKLWRAT